ncbi:MAG: hypothetical protein WD750_07725 [Gammaproteobacteria bacterium]
MSVAADTGSENEKEVPGATLGRMGEPAAADPDEIDFSKAEIMLWRFNHLGNIDRPGRLHYAFRRTGSFERGFKDAVYLDILEINEDGSKDTDLEFFSGPRQRPAAAENLVSVRGNPILGIYMQGDVYEMERLTEGSWRHFQRRIKLAFANGAEVEEVTIDHNGSEIDAEKITIRPYLKDPHRRDFEKFADKEYQFILSEHIPGSIYQIKTVIPDSSNPDGEPLIVEELTFQQADFKS